MANYRTFVRGKEKYSLYEKKQLGESLRTRGLCLKSAGTTTNCCWQESNKLYFLNRKHF